MKLRMPNQTEGALVDVPVHGVVTVGPNGLLPNGFPEKIARHLAGSPNYEIVDGSEAPKSVGPIARSEGSRGAPNTVADEAPQGARERLSIADKLAAGLKAKDAQDASETPLEAAIEAPSPKRRRKPKAATPRRRKPAAPKD
tara:strand:+ start:395 stop:820 length:426 start_codon:yes stop_codon:yes gene_type:complete